MWMDLKNEKLNYYKIGYEERKEVILAMLSWLIWKWEVFDNIYNYINNYSEDITLEDLDQVFENIIIVLIDENDEKIELSMWKLELIQNKIKQSREEELEEKKQENPENIVFDY